MKSKTSYKEKIAIVEIYHGHHVFVHTLASVLLKLGYEVTVFCTESIYRDLVILTDQSKLNIKWVTKDDEQTDFRFLSKIKKQLNKNFDLVFFNTIQGRKIAYFYLFMRLKVRSIVVAGRISEFFTFRYKIFGFKTIRELLHHNYTRFFLQKCLPFYDAMLIHTDQAKKLALDSGYSKRLLSLPFSLYKGERSLKDSKIIKFVVTGSINEKSRDHIGLLDSFHNLWLEGYDFSLTILAGVRLDENRPGQAYVRKVLKRMNLIKEEGFDITFFPKWISEEDYLKEAKKADFFISPLNKDYYFHGELTSCIVECIRQGRPGIYPEGYLPDPNLSSSSIHYKSMGKLKGLIITLLESKEMIEELDKGAEENSVFYNLDNTCKRFRNELEGFL